MGFDGALLDDPAALDDVGVWVPSVVVLAATEPPIPCTDPVTVGPALPAVVAMIDTMTTSATAPAPTPAPAGRSTAACAAAHRARGGCTSGG